MNCKMTRHCVNWGFCPHCKPELYKRVLAKWQEMTVTSENATKVYARLVAEEKRRSEGEDSEG